MQSGVPIQSFNETDEIDFGLFFRRVLRGLPMTIGLALVGLALTSAVYYGMGPSTTVITSIRVTFSFSGFEKGQYPDESKFSPDDLRAPEIVTEVVARKFPDGRVDASEIRSALTIEGVIPDNIVKERDKQRALGQPVRPYVPDEYIVTLSLPRKFPLAVREREVLLNELVSVYQERFTRTYVNMPLEAGKAFEALEGADYFDYDIVLNQESANITNFLTEMSETARAFRSPQTNLSFSDLLKQSRLFTQIRLNEVLGLIRRDGLSKDRNLAMVKMDYYLKTLADEELRAVEEEKVVNALLKQIQDREQRYALGIKSESSQQRSDGLVVDQGLVDSLLANDAYNFLVREALKVGLKSRRIQSEKAILQERRDIMNTFINSNAATKDEAIAVFQKSLEDLEKVYDNLINNIRVTYENYQQQQYSDAIRVSMQARTGSFHRGLVVAGIIGAGIGGAVGLGLSLLGLGLVRRHPTAG